jgi:hypothetical protein
VGTLALLVAALFFPWEQRAVPVLQRLAPALPAVLVALAAGLASVLTGARRFQAYGLVLIAAAAVTVLLDRGPALPLVVGGVVVVASGVILLTRFVRASRRYQEEA